MTPNVFHEKFLKVTKSKSASWWANGQCYVYVYCFLSVVGGKGISYQTKDLSGHIFIRYKNKYFDAELVHSHGDVGLENWKHLQPYLIRAQSRLVRKHRSLSSIVKLWGMREETVSYCEDVIAAILKSTKI